MNGIVTLVMMGAWWLAGLMSIGTCIYSYFRIPTGPNFPYIFGGTLVASLLFIIGQFFNNTVEGLSLSWFAFISIITATTIVAAFDKQRSLQAILVYIMAVIAWIGYLFPDFYF